MGQRCYRDSTRPRKELAVWGRNLTEEDSAISTLRYLEADSFFFSGRSFAATPRPGAEYGVTFRYFY